MPEPIWVALIAMYLHTHHWPGPHLAITAVKALKGELKVFRQDDHVHVARAVAASSAVPRFFPPVDIDGDRYIDGGTRTITNADVAAGHDTVIVFIDHHAAPTGEGPLSQAAIDAEVAGLRAGGSEVIVVAPDDDSLAAMGDFEALNPDRLKPAARAGHRQGEQEAERIAARWPSR
jgi:NTE family protein